jgi:hypothetical protein
MSDRRDVAGVMEDGHPEIPCLLQSIYRSMGPEIKIGVWLPARGRVRNSC